MPTITNLGSLAHISKISEASSSVTSHSIAYRPDVDGLRAIAVLAVITFHAFPNFIRGGFIGVDIFFVISGYLITNIILKKVLQGNFSFTDFYSRRIRRIFPALLLVTSFCLVFGWYILMKDEYQELGKQIAAGMGFVANILFWNESGYFDNDAISKPLLHLWSLGVEEQFYLIWPFAVLLATKHDKNPLPLILIVLVASFSVNILILQSHPEAAYFSPFTRFWELMLGSGLAYLSIPSRHLNRTVPELFSSPFLRNAMAVLGVGLIGVGLLTINKATPFPGWWGLLPTVGTLLLIIAESSWINRNILGNKAIVGIGLISYPLYLWHWPILSLLATAESTKPPHLHRVIALLISVLLAWLTYALLEKKIRASKKHTVVPILAILGIVMLTLGTSISFNAIKSRLDEPGLDKLLLAFKDWEFPSKSFEPYRYNGQDYFKQIAGSKTTLFIGDSNMQQYGPAVSRLLLENRNYNSAIFTTTGGCPPIPNVYVKEHPDCQPRLASAIKLALESNVETVVIGGCWYCYFVEATKKDSAYDYYFLKTGDKLYFNESDGSSLAMKSLAALLQKLAASKKVYLILNAPAGPMVDPIYSAPGLRLGLHPHFGNPPGLNLEDFEKQYGSTKSALLAMAAMAGVKIIDPVQYLCKDNFCPAVTEEGVPMYMDARHLRATYVRSSVGYLETTLKPIQ